MKKTIWKPGNMLYPVPAVMVSCGQYEKPGDELNCNIVTIAWTGTVCSDPAMTYVSIRPSRHSYSIIQETGEFVINLTSNALTKAMDFCGVRSGRDLSKFEHLHLTPQKAETVKAPLIAESPVNLECKVVQILPLGSHDMFLAEITAVHVAEEFLDEAGRFHMEKAGLIAYSHGTYFELGKAIGTFGYSVRKKNTGKAGTRRPGSSPRSASEAGQTASHKGGNRQ